MRFRPRLRRGDRILRIRGPNRIAKPHKRGLRQPRVDHGTRAAGDTGDPPAVLPIIRNSLVALLTRVRGMVMIAFKRVK